MGFIGTVNVFTLLVVPSALLVRGTSLPWRLFLTFALLGIVAELVKLFVVDALGVDTWRKHVCIAIDVGLTGFAMLHKRFLRNVSLNDNVEISLPLGFVAADVLLNSVGELYQQANTPAFLANLLLQAVHTNEKLVMLLIVAKILLRNPSYPMLMVCMVLCVFEASVDGLSLDNKLLCELVRAAVLGSLLTVSWLAKSKHE